MKKISLLLALIMIFSSAGVFADYETGYKDNIMKIEDGTLLETPPENVFRLDSDDQEFILLDTADDENSTFFCTVKTGLRQCRLVKRRQPEI